MFSPSHAEISKSRSKSNPYKVRYLSGNGKLIAPSETLSTVANCKKNIRAMKRLFIPNVPCNISIQVIDKSGKKIKKYSL